MNKLQRSKQTFKKGDIVSPFFDVKNSNGNNIQKLIKAVVVGFDNYDYSSMCKQVLVVKIIEGSIPYTTKRDRVEIYSNSVELCKNVNHYEIF